MAATTHTTHRTPTTLKTMCNDTKTLLSLFRLSQLSDSALPVGGFSFSLGLEAAVEQGLVGSVEELEAYTTRALHNAAECDGVALLEAYRAATLGDHSRLVDADHRVASFKSGEEQRAMTLKMGRRLADLLRSICPTPLTTEYHRWATEGVTPCTYPVAQAVAGVALSTGEEALFAAHLYGVASTIVAASLRLMRLSHFDTQRILYRLAPLCERLYDHYRELSLEQMASFSPTLELAASLHERGRGRLFMN